MTPTNATPAPVRRYTQTSQTTGWLTVRVVVRPPAPTGQEATR